jgi:CubicO group peptidase (beta-lactamase class C family)
LRINTSARPLALLLLLAGIAARPAIAQSADELRARVEAPRIPGDSGLAGRTLDELLTAAMVPGASVAVIRDFEIHWAKGYGVADGATGRAVDTRTRFQAASISKPVTAMAVMRLVQDGTLSLDADINATLRSWKVPESELTRTQKVTWRSLLSHTSGADDGFGFPGYKPDAPRPTLVQILDGEQPSNVKAVTFARPPYARFKYSGGGSTIVQLALTDLTQRDFAAWMREMVLTPLGMTNSGFEQPAPAALHGVLAHAHSFQGKPLNAPWHVYPEQSAAGLWTTAEDLARFVIEIQRAARGPEGAVLSHAAAREMLTPVGTGPFGVGPILTYRGEGWYFSHSGGNWGFRANIEGHVRKGYGLVVMTNGDGGGRVIGEIRERVSRLYEWDAVAEALRR